MKRILKEPMLHFILLAAGLFMVYGIISRPGRSEEPGKIIVTQGQVENLLDSFIRAWQRPPTPEELAGLVRDHVREEVCCREAIAMGLDKDDTIIRRRLRQKFEFVSEDIATMTDPTDAELDAFFQTHLDMFRIPQRFTFCQLYLNPEIRGHGENMTRYADELLDQLTGAGDKLDLSAVGDSFLLDREFAAISADEIAKQFGGKFAAQLNKLAPGQWHGPIESGYGMHLVLVRERTEEHLPALAEVRVAVRREWESARRLQANERFYEKLLKHYTVVIETPEPIKEGKKLAEVRR